MSDDYYRWIKLDHLINFPICTECKKEGQKPIKRPKTKDYSTVTLFVQDNELFNINNNNLLPSLANYKFSAGDRNKVLINVGPAGNFLGISGSRRQSNNYAYPKFSQNAFGNFPKFLPIMLFMFPNIILRYM